MTNLVARRALASTQLLRRLIDAPDLVRTLRALPAPAFAALIHKVGLEDAGELVALASTAQLVEAFDEDLFANEAPGQREQFDARRFALWLEVLLEAGDEAAARRFGELSEDFVLHALSSLVLVLDHAALMQRMAEGGDDALGADKALESALCEEIDGYLLIARQHEGWDAALRLILALDRDQRAFLERVLDRAAHLSSRYVDDLEALSELLSTEESLAEDVEAEREQRRAARGYVEPRAARNFLRLAESEGDAARDPVTQAYFRELDRRPRAVGAASEGDRSLGAWLLSPEGVGTAPLALSADAAAPSADPLAAALRRLAESEPVVFAQRMEELVYLANVLLAGASGEQGRFRPGEAAEVALLNVSLGAELMVRDQRAARSTRRASEAALYDVLQRCPADGLFRKASGFLARRAKSSESCAFLRSRSELAALLEGKQTRRKSVA